MTTNFVSTNMLECQILGSFAVFKKYPNEQTLDIIKDLTSIYFSFIKKENVL